MVFLRAAIFAALFLFGGMVTSTQAQDIALTSRDNSITLTGPLLGFDGDFYRIDSIYGEVTVDASGVTCSGTACPDLDDFIAQIRVSGSATIGDVLMPALIESFALRSGWTATRTTQDETHFEYALQDRAGAPRARFAFRVTNTAEGFADLLANEADLVMALREVRDSEVALAREIGLGNLRAANRNLILALDALVPVAHPSNTITRLALPTLAQILSGQITHWQALGGRDVPIALHLRDDGSGLVQALEEAVLAPAETTLTAAITRHDSNEALDLAIAADPNALGLVSFSSLNRARPLILTGPCGFEQRVTRRNIKTEDYPLTRPMFLYQPARRLPKVGRDFLEFVQSPGAQLVIRRTGIVDQAPEEIPLDEQGDRLANAISVVRSDTDLARLQSLVTDMGDFRRLTTSFRFEPGSSRLDAQSRANVQTLARMLSSSQFSGRSLRFVGFSDGDGSAAANLAIAGRRAETVRDAVLATSGVGGLGQTDVSIAAYGEAMPMGCDETPWGRKTNRRVEVWVK